ncbi:MAG: hypothetical protein DWP97_13180 [Calditrichaeota bacterium]|nr:MAG: hypothetical protein DWP97_13180 [Calditrichota bacterium]
MNNEKYNTAGWLAIISGLLFPLAMILDIMSGATAELLGYSDFPVGIGLADFIYIVYALFSIYVYSKFKNLLYEYYSYKKLNTIINLIIWLFIIFFGGSFLIELIMFPIFSPTDIGPPLFLLLFWGIGIFIFGVLDVLFAVFLLKESKIFSTEIKVFAIVILIMGLFELSVIFSFMNIFIIPIAFISWAFVFFKKNHEIDFV